MAHFPPSTHSTQLELDQILKDIHTIEQNRLQFRSRREKLQKEIKALELAYTRGYFHNIATTASNYPFVILTAEKRRCSLRKCFLLKDNKSGKYSVFFEGELPLKLPEDIDGITPADLTEFHGKLITIDQQTGVGFEIQGDRLVPKCLITEGDGMNEKPFKATWAAVKDFELFVGSSGMAAEPGSSWIKLIGPDYEMKHADWKKTYEKIQEQCKASKGFVRHEAAVWNPEHQRWMFLPRYICEDSAQLLSPELCGTNLMVAVSDNFQEIDSNSLGTLADYTRGFTSFKFVPGSFSEILAVKTVQLEGDFTTFISVMDLAGRVLLPDTFVDTCRTAGVEFVEAFSSRSKEKVSINVKASEVAKKVLELREYADELQHRLAANYKALCEKKQRKNELYLKFKEEEFQAYKAASSLLADPSTLHFVMLSDEIEILSTGEGSAILKGGSIIRHKDGSLSVVFDRERILETGEQEKQSSKLSGLVYLDGRLFTTDRRGFAMEIKEGELVPTFIVPSATNSAAFKCSWLAEKDGQMYIGSDGNVTRPETLYVHSMDSEGHVKSLDWTDRYQIITDVLGAHNGFIVNEAVVWSSRFSRWIICPKSVVTDKSAATPQELCGSNHLVAGSDDFREIQVFQYGPLEPLRGFTAVQFLPEMDEHVIALKTVALGQENGTYLTIFTLEGEVPVPETFVDCRRFAGLCFVTREQKQSIFLAGTPNTPLRSVAKSFQNVFRHSPDGLLSVDRHGVPPSCPRPCSIM